MLIEQIVELQWKGPGPLGLTRTSITGYFYDKAKISKELFQVGFHLLLKCCTRQCTLLPPTWTKSRTIFNSKMQDVKRVLNFIAIRRRIKQFNFFNWLSHVKNLVLSNDSNHVQSVIQWH